MNKKIDTIPKGLIPRLAKAELKACEHDSPAELAQKNEQDRKRNKAAREGRN